MPIEKLEKDTVQETLCMPLRGRKIAAEELEAWSENIWETVRI